MQLHLAALLASILPSVLPFVRCIFGFGAKEQRMLALTTTTTVKNVVDVPFSVRSFYTAAQILSEFGAGRVYVLLARVFEQPSCTPTTGG